MDRQDYHANHIYQQHEQDEKEISLHDILYIINRRKLWIILTFILVVGAVGVYLFFATPIFQATVSMRVDSPQAASPLANMFGAPTGGSRITTEVELIKSRVNIEEVVQRLGIYESYLEEFEGDEPRSFSSIVKQTGDRISVSTVRDTNIVRISVEDPDRMMAMNMANTLADVYNDMLRNIAMNEFQTRRKFIEQQIPNLEAELSAAEDNLRRYKEQEGIISLQEEARVLLQAVSTYDRQISPYRIQLDNSIETASVFQDLISQRGGSYPSISQVRRRDDVSELLSQLISLRLELASASAQAEGAGTADVRASIAGRENRLLNLLGQVMMRSAQNYEDIPRDFYMELAGAYTKVLVSETHISYLTSLRDGYQGKIRALPQIEQRLLELTREVNSRESLYILLLEKLEETKITEAGITGTAIIIDDAILPTSPVSPNRRLILAVGSLLGLFLGVLIAFLVETFDTSLSDEESIKRVTGPDLVVLGRIPSLMFSGSHTDELLVYRDPTSPGAEAFKLVSTNVLFSSVKAPQVIVVTSSEMGEGKTTVAANTAAAMAQNGMKTLIIDGDMRRPRIERIFNISKLEGGVVNYLLQGKEISSLIKKPFSDMPNLHVLPVGPLPPNPTSVLTSEKYRLMIEGLRRVYDRIILDVPPILAASDGLICSRSADGLVLVVRAGTATKRGVSMAMDSIRSSQINVLGLVVNDLSSDKHGYYHYYYYYSESSDKAMSSKARKRAAIRSAKKAMRSDRRSAMKLSSQYRKEQNGDEYEKVKNA